MNQDLHNPAAVPDSLVGPHHKLLSAEELDKPLPEGAEYWSPEKNRFVPSSQAGRTPLDVATYRIPLTLSDRLLQPRVMYHVYARQIGSSEWYPGESSRNEEDVIYWAKRNNDSNAKTFEEGAGREYIAVKAVTTFEEIKPTPPTPKTIPWTLESHPDVVCVKKKDRKGAEESHRQITRWYSDRAFIEDYGFVTYQELHSDWLQRNGAPAGQEVEG